MVSFKLEDRDLGYTEFFASIARRGVGLRVGVLGDDADKDHDGITLGDLAAVHEFGTRDKRVPQRSYLRSTFDENRKKYERLMDKAIVKLLRGKSVEREFEKLGQTMLDDIDKKVASNIPPPLTERYARRKEREFGFRDPALIASGDLMKAISAEVGVLGD